MTQETPDQPHHSGTEQNTKSIRSFSWSFPQRRLFSQWWKSAAGGADVLKIALPMIISSGSYALMLFADRVFLTWYSPEAMGASFSAGQFFMLLTAFPFSVASYVNAFVSQYNGSKQHRKIGTMVWQGIFLGTAVWPLYLILLPFYPALFRLFGHTPNMASLEACYLSWSLTSVLPVIANEALSGFFVGRKKTLLVMLINTFAVFLNVVLDYVMIFGYWGFPEWGLAGAAIATSISQWVRMVIYFVLAIREEQKNCGKYGFLHNVRLSIDEIKSLLRFGGMGGVQFVLEMGTYAFFILLIGMTGSEGMQATAIAFNLNAFTFLPVIGSGIAVTTLVGNYIGENNVRLARKSVYSALGINAVFTGLFMFLYLYCPDTLLIPYLHRIPDVGENFVPLTRTLLQFVAVYLFFDTINVICASALKGAGDTRFILIVTMLAAPALTVLPWLGIHFFGFGLYWCWTILTVLYAVLSVVYVGRFLGSRWLQIRLFSEEPKA